MSLKALKFALVGCVVLVVSGSASAATVTMTENPAQVRTQTQGLGTYDALDFFWTNAVGAEFTNYRLIVTATTGSLFDPARLQDDRQSTPQSGAADGNTAGHVDTWANTVMSAAAKDDGGYAASITVNTGSYSPAGTGAAPPFTFLDWSVFDTQGGDDNNLADHPDGSFPSAAPYHIARVVASQGATGTAQVQAFDTANPGIASIFNFTFGVPPNTQPEVVDYVHGTPYNANDPGSMSHQFAVVDPDAGQTQAWSGPTLLSFTPNYGGTGPDSQTPFIDPTLTAGGLFEWTSQGSRRGDYVWQVTATDSSGAANASGNGTITVAVTHVPEPSTIALFGLAMVGAVGLFRRR